MSTPAFDAIIAGGGLSGLSLAAHLATEGWCDRSVLIVDDPALTPAAVGWCFWSAAPGPLDPAVSRSFARAIVRADGRTIVLGLGSYRYRVVRRADLRRVVTRLVGDCPGFRMVSGHVDAVRDGNGPAEVVVDGETFTARWAFDSVTTRPLGSTMDARLAFTGYEVRADAPVFDDETPVLMDFRTIRGDGARFVYVLPQDRHRALVELTEFVPRHAEPPSQALRREILATYLDDVVGCRGYEVLRTESAVMALHTHPAPRRYGHVLAIGARGGLLKASTGYAYQRIEHDSAAIARSLVHNGHPFDIPAGRPRHRLLDAVLLDVLDRDPAQLERAFARLFSRNPAERVLRFLDEETSVADELRLIATLPPWPYLRALTARTLG
jgi:lycopene beta-cyclase